MAKRLYDLLKPCQEEEEVKSEFAKFFKIKYNTRNKIDLYTPQILFEFKLDQNFSRNYTRAKAVAQTLYYIRKLKYGPSTDPVPPAICVVDKNEGFFVLTSELYSFYSASRKYDWDRAPSQPCPVLVDTLSKSDIIAKLHVYSFEDPTDEENFSLMVFTYAQEDIFSSNKKTITEDNFMSVFLYWERLFGQYVQNGHKSSEYFVSDIEAGRSKIYEESNEVIFRLNDQTISK